MNIISIIKMLSAFASALSAIHNSAPGQAAEKSVEDLINHMTPGKPNSPALSPTPGQNQDTNA